MRYRNVLEVQQLNRTKMFEQAFEVGIKSGTDGSSHVGRTQGVADSSKATYQGSGGPGVVADMDALYA